MTYRDAADSYNYIFNFHQGLFSPERKQDRDVQQVLHRDQPVRHRRRQQDQLQALQVQKVSTGKRINILAPLLHMCKIRHGDNAAVSRILWVVRWIVMGWR